MNLFNNRNIATNRCRRQCSWLCCWGGMCPMRSPVPVPVPVRVRVPVSSAVGVRSGSHFRCRQTWKPVALFALRNGSPDRHNYNYTCIYIIIIIIIIKGGNTLWQRGNWWRSTNKAPRWEPKNLLPQHLELGWHRVQRVGGTWEWGGCSDTLDCLHSKFR